MRRYYWKVICAAWRAYVLWIKGGVREVTQFVIQTTVFLAILFFLPWFGEMKDEARLVAAGVVSILASAMLSFLIELVRAPAVMAEHDARTLAKLGNALRFNEDSRAVRKVGYEIYERWLSALPPNPAELSADWSKVGPIEKEAEAFIAAHYSHWVLMSYRHGTGYRAQRPANGTPQFYERRLDSYHTILLSYSTEAQELVSRHLPVDWEEISPPPAPSPAEPTREDG